MIIKEGINYYKISEDGNVKQWIGDESTMELVDGEVNFFPVEEITVLSTDEKIDLLRDDVDYLILKTEGVI